ncbi:piggyBac transposable element-derived protein 4-like [Xyrichtys novacula]|uniref:PiggyBac transposable element-derived protein 4-like n=1 Tax=Xyrichtys novacula TaxID=13765 RepID=A0AAV1GN65_XYRNO|nr:piggyBac transposable element-derived protein 4-like [Xyrichtys novacula]
MEREGEEEEEEQGEERVIAGEREEQAKEEAYDKQERGRKDRIGEATLPLSSPPMPLRCYRRQPAHPDRLNILSSTPATSPPRPEARRPPVCGTLRARRAADKLAAVREVWDMWSERLLSPYNPRPEITVDEQLVPFRGHCPFRQYIPSKPAKYGIKTWVACDFKSSYAWKMQVYTGKATATDAAAAAGGGGGGGGGEDPGPRAAGHGPEKNLGMRVVLDVTEGLRDRNLTCDNFFTSYELGQQLLKRKMTMFGTVRKNKPELPLALLSPNTKHTEAEVSDRRDRMPVIILDYNRCKGVVDNLDKVIRTYSCRRMTARWPLVVFHNILDVSSYNAFVIWRELNPEWMPQKRNKRRVFLERLGKALVTPLIERRERLPRTEASAAVVRGVRRAVSRSRTRGEGEDAEIWHLASGDETVGRVNRCHPSLVVGLLVQRTLKAKADGQRWWWWSSKVVVIPECVALLDNKVRVVPKLVIYSSCRHTDNTVSVNDDDYCEKESDEREEGSHRSDEHQTARDLTGMSDHDVDFYRDNNSPQSRYEYDDYHSDTAELDVEGHFSEDEAWENNPDEDLVTPGDMEDTSEADLPHNSFVDQHELFNHSDEHQTPRDLKGTSDHDADFYQDSNSPWSRCEYDDYHSDTAELEVEGHFSEDEAWRNTPDEEYDHRGLLSERHVEGDIVEDEKYYPYSDSLGTPGDTEDTSEADLPHNSFMDQSELLNDEICIILWDCDKEVEEEFGSNNRYASTCRWTELQESWKSFVSWLGERWWGSVSEESVRTFMDTSERRRIGDIVVSACFDDDSLGYLFEIIDAKGKRLKDYRTFHWVKKTPVITAPKRPQSV